MRTIRLTNEMVSTIGSALCQHRRYLIQCWLDNWNSRTAPCASDFWAREIQLLNDAHRQLHYGTSLVD